MQNPGMSTSLSHVAREVSLSLFLTEKLLTPRLRAILSGRVSGQDFVLNAWLCIGIDADKESGTQLLHTLGKRPNALFLNGYGKAPSKIEQLHQERPIAWC